MVRKKVNNEDKIKYKTMLSLKESKPVVDDVIHVIFFLLLLLVLAMEV